MHGLIKCPITDEARRLYGNDFSLLSIPASCSSGYIYLRGGNPIGVAMTRTFSGDVPNRRWVCCPQISDSALSETGLSKEEVLKIMVYDSCYGDECRGTAIRLNTSDDYSRLVESIGDFRFTNSPDGSRIGLSTNKAECVDESDEVSEDCINSINGMWSLNVIDPAPVRDIIAYVESFADTHRKDIKMIYGYAEKAGKYQDVPGIYQLSSILDTYEEYFNDLTQFIKARLDDTGATNCSVDTATATIKALDIDEKFFSDMFDKRCAVMYPAATIETCNAIIAFSNFLYSVYDNFIAVRDICSHRRASTEDLSLINVYGYSASRFTKRFVCELVKNFNALVGRMNGVTKAVDVDKTREYVLL